MVVAAAFTGMRWGEVCAMRCAFLHLPGPDAAGAGQERAWYEVDARIGAVHEDVHARRYFGPPKGGRGRIVDLPPFLAALLARHIQGGRGAGVAVRQPPRRADPPQRLALAVASGVRRVR
jgi:integrase